MNENPSLATDVEIDTSCMGLEEAVTVPAGTVTTLMRACGVDVGHGIGSSFFAKPLVGYISPTWAAMCLAHD